MKTTGIITEYNPFHNGHAYQINNIRQAGADNIVTVMSGNFVQRGAPAFTDKYLRTKMALCGGADFVFELPVIYATASAGLFALGGVSMLDSLGFVDSICFGSECDDIDILNMAADITLTYDYEFNSEINNFIKSGISYPKARHMTIKKYLHKDADKICQVLENPNNILAIEYLKALKLLKSNIRPFVIKRCDNGYNNTDYKGITGNFASASAVRNAFAVEKEPLKIVSNFLPESTLKILAQNIDRININENMFSNLLYYKLRNMLNTSNNIETIDSFTKFLDVSDMLANRIINKLDSYSSFTEFIKMLKTKDYTYSRISRSLLHILLDIHKDSLNITKNSLNSYQITPYARLLGMNKNKSSMLRDVKQTTLITKTANAVKKLDSYSRQMFEKDIFAADIYRQTTSQNSKNSCPDEYRAGIIIL